MNEEQRIKEAYNILARAANLLEGITEYKETIETIDQAIDLMMEKGI